MWQTLVPYLGAAAFGGLGSLFQDQQDANNPNVRVQGWRGPVDDPGGPPTREALVGSALGDAVSAQENWLSTLLDQAMAPVSLPGVEIPAAPTYAGGALPMQLGSPISQQPWTQAPETTQPGLTVAGMSQDGDLRQFFAGLSMLGVERDRQGGLSGGC